MFRRCKREDQGVPVFAEQLEQWDTFVESYQDRKLRETTSKLRIPQVRCGEVMGLAWCS